MKYEQSSIMQILLKVHDAGRYCGSLEVAMSLHVSSTPGLVYFNSHRYKGAAGVFSPL